MNSGDAYMHLWNLSSLAQIMAWCQIGAKPLPEPMLDHWHCSPQGEIALKFYQNMFLLRRNEFVNNVYKIVPIFSWHLCANILRSRTTLKFWSATMFGAAARNFGPVHKFELPTVIADCVPRATRVFSLASVGHMVSHMVPMARCRPPYWKIFTVNNLATVF